MKRVLVVVFLLVMLVIIIKQLPEEKVSQRTTATTTYKLYMPGVSTERNIKRGVSAPASCSEIARLRVSWTYTYYPITANCPGVENVPMVQAESQMGLPVISNSAWLMGFNEPDILGWARQSAAGAAINWRTIETNNPTRLLVSPSPSSFEVYDKLGWLRDFRKAYIDLYGTPPRLNALAVHIYFSSATDAISVVNQAIALAKSWGIAGVWVTEFGLPSGQCGSQSELKELVAFLDYLDRTPEVMRYSHFGARFDVSVPEAWYPSDWCDLSLVRLNGGFTPFGTVYSTGLR